MVKETTGNGGLTAEERAFIEWYRQQSPTGKRAVNDLLQAEAQRMTASRNVRDGLPELTEEDLEAISEMRAKATMGNGRSGNVAALFVQEQNNAGEEICDDVDDLDNCSSVLDDLISEE